MIYITKFEPHILRALAFFLSTDETRLAINGIKVEVRSDNVALIATNARGLIAYKSDWDKDYPSTFDFIIPPWVIDILPQESRVPWELQFDDSDEKIVLRCANYSIHTKAIEERYPVWRSVIPHPLPTKMPEEFIGNAGLMASAAEGLEVLFRGRVSGIVLAQEDASSPLVLKSRDLTVCIMPMRVKGLA